VIVPGYMGSLLRDKNTGQTVWIDFAALRRNPLKIGSAIDEMLQKMAYPNDDLEPAGIMNQVLIMPPFAKQEHYGRLLDAFKLWGYQVDPASPQPEDLAVYTFAYDWRQDNRISARQLGEAIQRWEKNHPGAKAWLIAHSNGGIVSRWYIQKEGGDQHVGRLFLMGSPWDGAPKTIKMLMDGLEVLGMRRFNLWNLGVRMKEAIRSFPSFYQIVPVVNPFLRDEDNQEIDLFGNPTWLDSERDRRYLADARQFNQDIAGDPGVDTICFYGTRKPTTTAGVVRVGGSGLFEDIQWIETGAGDGTVPERSARHPWFQTQSSARWRPFPVTHGDIYIDDGVLAFLKQELVDQYKVRERAVLSLPDLSVTFEPQQDFYAPGEAIGVWAELTDPRIGQPIRKATVKAWLAFRQPLPGSEDVQPPEAAEPVRLVELAEKPGRYEASLVAPAVEGYYTVHASIQRAGKPLLKMEELVVVEAV
jgi:hypothetical protein